MTTRVGLAILCLSTSLLVAETNEQPPIRAAIGVQQEVPEPPHLIPVKIVADETEPAVRRLWESRWRARLKAASEITERTCRIRFEVVAVETWRPNPETVSLQEVLREFEKAVEPAPARLAIGFTSRPHAAEVCTRLGTTRGPLHTHMLLREWHGAQTEPERLEILLHELGHFLGAAHSKESDSVMRPRLGDGQARSAKFQIGFDSLSAEAMRLVTESARNRDFPGIAVLHAETREKLLAIYGKLRNALPDDPVASEYLRLLGDPHAPPRPAATRHAPLIDATQQVMAAVIEAAARHREQPRPAGSTMRWPGDTLTDDCFRVAAATASKLPRQHATAAFLLGLAASLDTSDLLRKNPLTREIWSTLEDDAARHRRLEIMQPTPTMYGRHDLTQHFVVSSALTALLGAQAAEVAGVMKELHDSKGGSGFSFADLAADLAGIIFATRVRSDESLLPQLAKSFRLVDYVIAPAGFREGLTHLQFEQEFGSASDARFRAERDKIHAAIEALPGFSRAPAP